MDTSNRFLVGAIGERVVIQLPPAGPMTAEEAVALAAWLVALADPSRERFDRALEEICRA